MTRHAHTPRLDVVDPRGLGVRHVAWCRIGENDPSQQRVSRRCLDVTGRSVAEWDPRLWANALPANVVRIHSLSGLVLLEDSVDAGWRVHLGGADGQVIETTDSKGSHRRADFDESQRLMAVTETALDGQPVVVERYGYGDPSSASAQQNQCARLIRHDDPAGTWQCNEFSLAGRALIENRRFLQDSLLPDWPVDLSQRDQLLETGEGYTTATAFDATALPVSQTDAAGNQRTHRHTVSGLLQLSTLQTGASQSVQTLVSNIRYDAFDQIIEETLGNGVTCRNEYELTTSRLIRMTARKTDGATLQDLIYHYDPVGNIVSIEDKTQAVRHFNQRRIEPVSRYVYDSLYQLIEASGREVSTGASHGPELPSLQNLQPDPNNLSPYTQHYEYDAGGNLLQLRHVGAQPFTRTMLVAAGSNRSLPQDETEVDLEDGFDANGNLQALIRGQALRWDVRNQLRQVTTVQREESDDDDEVYVYDGAGQRCRKIRTARAATRTLTWEVRYLPGLEIRSEADGEILHVCTAQAGRSSVRLLHWAANKPEGIANDQLRYSLNDHLGSSALELDDKGGRISEEGYYPYGGTAWWAARSAVEAKYKTVRYSGKERDASGLYYYGFRYYAPWLQRWLNPDPAGAVDGLNIYHFVSNTPLNKVDGNGLTGTAQDKAATVIQKHVRRHLSPIRVKTVTEGVIGVSITGSNAVFAKVGMYFDREPATPREFTYLALSNRLKGKVAGGDGLITLSSARHSELADVSGVNPVAYINGGFFNMGRQVPYHNSPEYASIGENFIDNKHKPRVEPPEDYRSDYSKLELSDGSYIHTAPKLTARGVPQFSQATSLNSRYRYSAATGGVGALGHAGDPNSRSGISLAENETAMTRIAIVLNYGRGSHRTNSDEPGLKMFEWSAVMARLDNLNEKINGLPAASSWNLDGGDSSSLGVFGPGGERLFHVDTLRTGRSGRRPPRPVGNGVVFYF